MVFLALDVGDKTIGVAASDELGWTAQPVRTIRRSNLAQDLDELAGIVEERQPARFVIGLPINMDDTEGPRAAKTRRFAEHVAARFALPIVLWDERLSTWEAERMLREMNVDARKRKAVIDTVAAVVILKSYLDSGSPEQGI
ncbi:Holliday junction resolvase RuvX [Vulgatibacter sp.]|uniref:Holliday junction resolvase RuvX n=1 Tax=Vulgatibacter sp. TaxID=1971226 RepID=UPI003568BF72